MVHFSSALTQRFPRPAGTFLLRRLQLGRRQAQKAISRTNWRTAPVPDQNENWFLSLANARGKIEDWRRYYNAERPHGALGNLAGKSFALKTPAAVR